MSDADGDSVLSYVPALGSIACDRPTCTPRVTSCRIRKHVSLVILEGLLAGVGFLKIHNKHMTGYIYVWKKEIHK